MDQSQNTLETSFLNDSPPMSAFIPQEYMGFGRLSCLSIHIYKCFGLPALLQSLCVVLPIFLVLSLDLLCTL